MKKSLLLIALSLSVHFLYAQKSLIISQNKVDWKKYPKLYKDFDNNQFIDLFSFLEEVEVEEITYRSNDLKIEAYVAMPKKAGKYPVIIYNRGGNRDFGALQLFKGKRKYPVAYGFSQLAKEGYIVIGCNYRGCGKSEGKDEFGGSDVNDVLNLIEVVKELPKADASRIGMYGWSRGGMMTYLTLLKTDQIKAAIVGGAPSDKTTIERPQMEQGVYAELIPNYWENKEAELKKRSAYYFANQFSKDVPILILHGNSDWRVKSTHALKMALALDEHRVPYRLKIFEGGDHGLRAFRKEVNKEVLSWFDRFLKKGEPAPNMDFKGK
ncbi:alpha/beta hydrolase family protein [Aureispira anguillae]|uniref:Prolyl oligopeptidase family serine peptidase n=1 Tax=Aureispira anguillae TaxID=2864201 RepID=A0A915YL71_9BACT|nr:prolyl oligopeptidase family serine peptidase [Aureispira anguillae]BDS15049.1 prolyl oligopeptidase family serine peptidase [Aureispira anguillae]